jgi:adenosylcobinamide amidohydrolase
LGELRTPALVWDLERPHRVLSSTVLGGGLGERLWVINVQVEAGYARTDPARHLEDLARAGQLSGPGVGFLTAARVDRWTRGEDDGVEVYATVGLRHPEWAASTSGRGAPDAVRVGTINLVVVVPVALSDAAMVNAVATATEAKTQALLDADVEGTGTASDALCVLTPIDGTREQFCGPRSTVGGALARAVHAAVVAGAW